MKLANRYEVIRELGRGGMGIVYLARDPLLDREVAVKLIGTLNDDRKQRFLREARVIAKMDHPGIVGVFDLGEHEDGLFFVMPFVAGKNLRQVLGETPLKLKQLVDLGIEAAEALESSHALGIVHRDIKPENIMVVASGDNLRFRITDFGLAVHATEQRLTTTGALVGTVSYLSPEQVMGGAIDPRVDIYALGTVLYECIAGRTPFKGEIQSVLFRIVHEEPQPLGQLVQDLDSELEALVLSCLQKDANLRPKRAADVAAALTRYRAKIATTSRAGESMRTVEVRGGVAGIGLPAAPFVGRAKELAELQTRLNQAVGGESQLVLVEGEAGVGKTRLVEELERLAHARQIRVLAGNFNEQDGATPYQGFCEMLETHLRRASSSSSPELGEVEDELVGLFPILGELRGGRARAQRSQPVEAREQDRVAVFDVLARAFIRIAGDEPLLLVMDDLHLATVSVEALQYIARRLGPTRTLLLGTYVATEIDRAHPLTKLVDGFKGNKRFSLVHLDRFTREEHRSFLATVSLGAPVDETVALKLYEASEGNPFFTRELFRSLLDTGSITREGHGSYQLSGGQSIAFEAVPSTIQKAVARRLERLPDNLRDTLSIASVLGKSFEEHELEALLEDADVDLDDALEKLVRAGFLEEQRKGRGERLAFTSGTMRDVLYAELPRRKRRKLHQRVAEHLEHRNATKLDRVRGQLVHHYAQADIADKVIAYGLEHARAALATFSADEAMRAARAVLGFTEDAETADVEAKARALLAQAHRLAGDFDAALKELEAAIKLHEKTGDASALVQLYADAAFTAWESRRVADAKRWIDKGIKGARAEGADELLGKLLPLGITIANLRGDTATARELLEESERRSKREGAHVESGATGGTVRVALAGQVRATEPLQMRLNEEREVLSNAFETLLASDEHGNIVPKLVELWEAHDGGKRFTFTLRSGVTWHDGATLTAADVKASFERAARTSDRLPLAMTAMGGSAGIEVTSPTMFTITLAEALPIFPSLLTDFRTALARDPATGTSLPLGTGPFRVTSFAGDRIELQRHAGHWREPPALDGVVYHVGLSASELAAAFRADRHDIVRDLTSNEIEELVRDRRVGAKSVEHPQKNVYFALFNTARPLVSDPRVRAAMVQSIPASDLVWRHLGRLGRPAEGLIPQGILGHDAGRRHITITREQARALLDEAGLAAGTRLRAAIHPLLVNRHRAMLDGLLESWAAIGIAIENATESFDAFLASTQRADGIDLVIGRWGADYDDPDSFTYALFDTTEGYYRGFHSTPALDQACKSARLESSPQKRIAMYRAIEEDLLASHVILPLWHGEDCRVYGPKLQNVALSGTPPYLNYPRIRARQAGDVEPRRGTGGRLALTFDVGVAQLDPTQASTIEDVNANAQVFESLTRETGGARVVPWLAQSIRVEDDGKRYRFTLRDGVRFHDGRPLTARDVRYSFEHALAHTESSYAAQLEPIVGARAVAERTRPDLSGLKIVSPGELTIDLVTPFPAFAAILALTQVAIIPEGTDPSGRTSYRDGCIGTGAFRVVRFEPNRRLELEPNPFYWRAGYPRSEGVVFGFGVPSSEAVARLRAGHSSMVANPSPGDAEPLWSDPIFAAAARSVPTLATYVLVLNKNRPAFANRMVRQAVLAALDVDSLTRGFGRVVTPARSLIPPGLLGHDPGRSPVRRRETSSSLDVEVDFLVAPVFRARYERYTRAVIEELANAGIRVRVKEGLPFGQADQYDLFIGRWTADYPDPDTFTYQTLHSSAGMWGGFLGSAALDALIHRVRFDPDSVARDAACRDIEAMLAEEALLLPLFHDRLVVFAHPNVHGLDSALLSSGILDLAGVSVED